MGKNKSKIKQNNRGSQQQRKYKKSDPRYTEPMRKLAEIRDDLPVHVTSSQTSPNITNLPVTTPKVKLTRDVLEKLAKEPRYKDPDHYVMTEVRKVVDVPIYNERKHIPESRLIEHQGLPPIPGHGIFTDDSEGSFLVPGIGAVDPKTHERLIRLNELLSPRERMLPAVIMPHAPHGSAKVIDLTGIDDAAATVRMHETFAERSKEQIGRVGSVNIYRMAEDEEQEFLRSFASAGSSSASPEEVVDVTPKFMQVDASKVISQMSVEAEKAVRALQQRTVKKRGILTRVIGAFAKLLP